MKHSSTRHRCNDIALDEETQALGTATSAWRYQHSHGVSGARGVGVTPQMCNRVTNHGDMGTFSRPDYSRPSTALFMDFQFFLAPVGISFG